MGAEGPGVKRGRGVGQVWARPDGGLKLDVGPGLDEGLREDGTEMAGRAYGPMDGG